MKSTCKKFLAMFLAVLFVMGTMVTYASAVEEGNNTVIAEEFETVPYVSAKCVFQKGGILDGSNGTVAVHFTVPESGPHKIVIAAGSGGDLVIFGITNLTTGKSDYSGTTVNANNTFSVPMSLSSTCHYEVSLISTSTSPVSYSVLVFTN